MQFEQTHRLACYKIYKFIRKKQPLFTTVDISATADTIPVNMKSVGTAKEQAQTRRMFL